MRERKSEKDGRIVQGAGMKCISCYLAHRHQITGVEYSRVLRYGISEEQYQDLLDAQNRACAICALPEEKAIRRFAVDHDHSCCPDRLKSCGTCVRGLLCGRCNTALGHFRDSIDILRSASDYLSSKDRYVH